MLRTRDFYLTSLSQTTMQYFKSPSRSFTKISDLLKPLYCCCWNCICSEDTVKFLKNHTKSKWGNLTLRIQAKNLIEIHVSCRLLSPTHWTGLARCPGMASSLLGAAFLAVKAEHALCHSWWAALSNCLFSTTLSSISLLTAPLQTENANKGSAHARFLEGTQHQTPCRAGFL